MLFFYSSSLTRTCFVISTMIMENENENKQKALIRKKKEWKQKTQEEKYKALQNILKVYLFTAVKNG